MTSDFPLSPRARRSGSGWIDYCPAHDDHSPSLSIGKGADDRGLDAALRLCERAADAGWYAKMLHPTPGMDWNDILLEDYPNAD